MARQPFEDIAQRLFGHPRSRRDALRAGAGLAGAALAGTRRRVFAKPAASALNPSVTIIASGLANPRGLAWDDGGALYVALAGTDGATSPSATMCRQDVSVAKIAQGCLTPAARGLPSTRGMGGHVQGPSAVAFLGERLYVLQDAGATVYGTPDRPNGLYSATADGGVELVADTAVWVKNHPVAQLPADYYPEGETFGMVADADAFWVIESNSGQALRITPDGKITRVADLSAGHPIPTGPAASPGGGIYVGFLTPAPYVDGTSKVVEITPSGAVTEVWTGLTMVTAVAVGPDGSLYALEMSTGNGTQPPYQKPGSGKVVRRIGHNRSVDIAIGLPFPIAMAFGPDHALYVVAPAYSATNADGFILRLDVATGQVLDIRRAAPATSSTASAGCSGRTAIAGRAVAPRPK
jgi:hypothetical protein